MLWVIIIIAVLVVLGLIGVLTGGGNRSNDVRWWR